ncbi:adhesion G protein-coupled receptor E2-like [Palaemon carinicauda]|uniref:adhesion G protein-coupled receptor E2-like n=1 Tax=Palaemon carinicauda TaxID=392227 RepID=UPI0035B627A6
MTAARMELFGTLLMSAITAVAFGLRYEELQALNDCHPFDFCQEFKDALNCRCDELCSFYGDCCLNSQYFNHSILGNNKPKYSCVAVNDIDSVYVETTCKDDWNDEEIEYFCSRGSVGNDYRDPVAKLPATSLGSNITYANYYCAICNRDSESLILWDAGWECDHRVKRESSGNHSPVFKDGVWGINVRSGDEEKFIHCRLYPDVPGSLKSIVRHCIPAIEDCPSDWANSDIEHLCHSYTSVLYGSVNNYRNTHCAICNSVTLNNTRCIDSISLRSNDLPKPSFAALFDFADVTGSNYVGSVSKCQRTEIWDPFFEKCRNVVCGRPDQVFSINRCVSTKDLNEGTSSDPSVILPTTEPAKVRPTGGVPILFPTDSSIMRNPLSSTLSPLTESMPTVTGTASAISKTEEFQNCQKVLLSFSEFTINEDGSVYVQNYSKIFNQTEYQLADDGVLVCAPPVTTGKFSSVMAWVSLAGALASCLCLVLHLVAFFMVQDLRNLSGKNLASLCLALLSAYISFIVNLFIDPNPVDCIILAAVMYFCFLSAFCWMNATAFDIWYTFRLTQTQLRVTGGNQWHRFIAYSFYSWLIPALAVAVVVGIDIWQPEVIPEDFLPSLGANWCWFGHRKALLVFFALPITVMVILNVVFFTNTARIIAETTTATSSSTTSSHHKNQYKMHMRLAVLMGFTWLFGTVAGYLQVEAVYYIFVVLNTLQGVFIFLAFTFRRKVWRALVATSHNVFEKGTSWIRSNLAGSNSQNMELKNNITPSTSVEGW